MTFICIKFKDPKEIFSILETKYRSKNLRNLDIVKNDERSSHTEHTALNFQRRRNLISKITSLHLFAMRSL